MLAQKITAKMVKPINAYLKRHFSSEFQFKSNTMKDAVTHIKVRINVDFLLFMLLILKNVLDITTVVFQFNRKMTPHL